MNPLEAIQVGVTRRALDDSTGESWLPEQRVDLATMLRMYTLGGAVAGDDDDENGSLTRGKLADLIVLSDDLFKVPEYRIARTKVLLTMMGGRVVFRDAALIADADTEINALNARLADAYRRYDAATYATLFTDSAVFQWPASPDVRGRVALQGMARELWPPLKYLALKVIPSSRRIAGDLATEFGAFEESWDDAKGRNTEYGRYSAVMLRQADGRWLFDRWMGFEDSTRTRAAQ
jgi:ketosteroid isomerase-like protein